VDGDDVRKQPFAHHDSWTRAKSYQASITFPSKTLAAAAPEALLAYVQLRALIGGTTSIQGWPAANRRHLQVLRNIDSEAVGGTSLDLIRTSALTLKPDALGKVAQQQKQGAGFIYHCAEGQHDSLVEREFIDAANAGCLGRTFVGVHLTAIVGNKWERWAKAKAGAVAWSPFSNLWLYGHTTDIASARNQNIAICLGSDWGPSGTKNVQGELKVARLASQQMKVKLSDEELVAMVTSNPGDVLSRCWNKTIGRLTPGAFGDLTVIQAGGNKPVWTQVVESTEREVMLVVFGGLARYGDVGLMRTAARTPIATIAVLGRKRAFAIPILPRRESHGRGRRSPAH
jgi:cytosine/adenosine deaminase-related metal-dependent hydrolase